MSSRALVLFALLLTGCATAGEGISESGTLKGVYTGYYTSAPITLGSGAALRDKAVREGTEFCAKQGKKIGDPRVVRMQDAIPLDRFAVAQIVFECK